MVGAARLELTTPRSQSECATNCAMPRFSDFKFQNYVDYSKYFFDVCNFLFWGGWRGSNPRPSEPQSDALPTELHPPFGSTKRYRAKYTLFSVKINT